MTLIISLMLGAGVLLVASGLEGSSLVQTFQEIVSGQPLQLPGTPTSEAPTATTEPGSVATGSGGSGTYQTTGTITPPAPGKAWGFSQLVQLAQMAGFSGAQARIAAAIALAESGGNPMAYNPETGANTPAGHGSRGLWQIYGYAHPEYDNNTLYDPLTNARAAYAVYSAAGGFSPWTTYRTGAYNQYLQ